jgi:hypothetical protein
MKKLILGISFLSMIFLQQSTAQVWCSQAPNYTLDVISNKSDLIFEGRVLSDSVFMLSYIGDVCTSHRVLVLKEFKGQFKSDTIIVSNYGGRMIVNDLWQGKKESFVQKGDEAIFFVSTAFNSQVKINDSNFFWFVSGPDCGYVKVCNKKDVVKEVYEPIEALTGVKYIEVHPNTCAAQQKK